MAKRRVSFWRHIVHSFEDWWSDQITRENFQLVGWIFVLFVPFVLVGLSPLILGLLFGRSPLLLLSWLLVIPALFWVWFLIYREDPEFEET